MVVDKEVLHIGIISIDHVASDLVSGINIIGFAIVDSMLIPYASYSFVHDRRVVICASMDTVVSKGMVSIAVSIVVLGFRCFLINVPFSFLNSMGFGLSEEPKEVER